MAETETPMTEHPAVMMERLLQEKHNLILDTEKMKSGVDALVEEIERECMRDGGSYWLPAHQNKVEDWCGRLRALAVTTP